MIRLRRPPWLLITVFSGLLVSLPSFAADAQQNNALDSIIENFRSQSVAWEPVIHDLTLGLFWGLVTISLTWTFIQLIIKEGTGLVDVLAELTRRTMLIGFSVWMMNEAPHLARALIASFVKVGTTVSGGSVHFSPSNVFEMGLNIITIAWDSASVMKPVSTLMMFLAALIILICFALMAMEMTILIVSGYLIVSGGIIAMGFLGCEWTRDNAINYFTAVLGVAFKMFIMQLVFIVGYSFIEGWGRSVSHNSETIDYLVLLGTCIVFAGLMREIPQMAASLASGRFTMQGGGVAVAATNFAAGVAGGALMGGALGSLSANVFGGGSGGSNESGYGDAPATVQPQPTTMDTGPGDDGKAFAARMRARAAAGADAFTASPAGATPLSGADTTGRDSAPRKSTDRVKGAVRATGSMTKGMLETVATRSAFGRMLAEGAKRLGEDPVDPATASAMDIHRQLDASLNRPPQYSALNSDPTVETPHRFRDNITSADNSYVQEEKEQYSSDADVRNG